MYTPKVHQHRGTLGIDSQSYRHTRERATWVETPTPEHGCEDYSFLLRRTNLVERRRVFEPVLLAPKFARGVLSWVFARLPT